MNRLSMMVTRQSLPIGTSLFESVATLMSKERGFRAWLNELLLGDDMRGWHKFRERGAEEEFGESNGMQTSSRN